MPRALPAAKRPLDARLRAPGSKSVTHRALVAAALADGRSTISGSLDATDIGVTVSGLSALGVTVEQRPGDVVVEGCGGRLAGGAILDLKESGTSLRLLAAVAALGREPSRLDGTDRLRDRPLAPLCRALRTLGATVTGDELPLTVGGTAFHGGDVRVAGSPSSQFASALMSIGPSLPGGVNLQVEEPAVSLPYVELTASVMRTFGVNVTRTGPLAWSIPESSYVATAYTVEGDHSSSSYFLAAPLIAAGRVRVHNLDPSSDQPDSRLASILERMGAGVERGDDWIEVRGSGQVRAFDVSLAEAPDLVPTVAVLALFADGPSTIRDVPHLRVKESDRLRQLAVNLNRLGRDAEVHDDRIEIREGRSEPRDRTIETAGDHRIAMAFALAGLRIDDLQVDDPACVAKSYPDFWRDWGAMLKR